MARLAWILSRDRTHSKAGGVIIPLPLEWSWVGAMALYPNVSGMACRHKREGLFSWAAPGRIPLRRHSHHPS